MGGLLAALGVGGGAAAGGTALGTAAGTAGATAAGTAGAASALQSGGFLASALSGLNKIEGSPGVQLARKLSPMFSSPPAPGLSSSGGNESQVIPRRRVRMFE